MKNIYPNLLPLLFLSVFFCLSCEKNKLPTPNEIDEKPCWQLHPEVTLDRRLLIQSFTTEDFIYLLSHNYLLKMDENGLLEDHFISENGNFSLSKYPMLNDKLFAMGLFFYTLNKIEIFSTQHPGISTIIDPQSIDSSFQNINYFTGNGMNINDDNKLLFSVRKKYIQGVPDPNLYFWMFDCLIEDDHLTITFDKEIKIEIPGSGNISNQKLITNIFIFENDFYCSINAPVTTFKINSQGDYKELFPLRDTKIFKKNDTLFALGHTRECTYGYAIKAPQNQDWASYSLAAYDGCWGQFYQINDRFVSTKNEHIWELKINHSDLTYNIREIDGNCLQKSAIRRLFEFKDKVYLATLDGLYVKDLKYFFIYKDD